ncbi:SDR family oxidoreductase [Chitinophaga sp. sic0106]|uniref:SDR family oxidoreductase n=1 Tax=Chitinophaga sp. sic0106 TaxID=2854785 RepID=UPI001C437FA5|nr:SDR family oxidoreductase [Chitinophaga sp. sic0106]MBV7532345.1 SDR family oxidoreductase [Chitinophaga sp. sic0106]
MNTISTTPTILLTGATGKVGTYLTRQLAQQGIPFRAMVRNREDVPKLSSLPGAEVVLGDFDHPDSLRQAVAGIESAFLLTNSTAKAAQQQITFTDIAAGAGVKQLVKLSQYKADAASPVRFLRYHAAVEAHIKASGMAYTFLRPNLFMQGFLLFKDNIIHQGKFFAPAGSAKVSVVDARDIAAVAAQVLVTQHWNNRVLDITGPEALSHEEIAAILSAITGRHIRYIDVTPEDMLQAVLSLGFPVWQAEGLIEDYAHYARGEAAAVSSTVQLVTGKPARSFAAFIADHAAYFKS